MKRRGYIFAILFLLVTSEAFSFEFITGQGLGMGQTVLLSRSSASTLLSVPSGGISDGIGKIELGINRKFEIKDLDQSYLVAAYRKNLLTCVIGFTQFGYTNMYAERTAKVALALHHNSLSLGATLSTMLVDFGDNYERLSGSSFGFGASYRSRRIYGAITVEDVNSPQLDDNSVKIDPRVTAYAEIIGRGSYSITGRIILEKDEEPRIGAGQKIDLSSISSLFWGLSTRPTVYGGGLEIFYRASSIMYASSYHPTLGFSHTLAVNYTFGRVSPARGKNHE